MADHDRKTDELASQLFEAWNSGASTSVYAEIRDQLLAEHEHIDTRIATLATVVHIACPSIGISERQADSQWERLFSLATSIDSGNELESIASLGKRKRTCSNRAIRTRNLAVVSSFWSPEVLKHYGWDASAQGQAKMLRACAMKFPHFKKDFIPRLNCILLQRHQEAIQFGRRKTLNDAPLQPQCDLDVLALQSVSPDAEYEDLWVKCTDGSVPFYPNGIMLKDLRPHHFQYYLLQRDKYGMLVAQERSTSLLDFTTRSASATVANCSIGATPSLWCATPKWMGEFCNDGLLDISLVGEEATVCPLALHVENPVGLLGANSEQILLSQELDHGIIHSSTEQPTRNIHLTTPALEGTTILDATYNSKGFRQPPAGVFEAALIERESLPTLESDLRRRHDQVLRSYIASLSDPAATVCDGDRRWLRTQWLNADTKLACLWTSEGLSLPLGGAASEDDADVLYYSSKTFVADVQAGKVFRKPVVIKESFSDAGMHTAQTVASMIEDTSGTASLQVQSLDNTTPISVDVTRFSASLRMSSNGEEGLHTLNLRHLIKAHKPVFTAMRRFRLLDSLTERLYRDAVIDMSPVDVASYMSFNIAALAGAFSGPYIDAVSGTWARVIDGVKLWAFVPEEDMTMEWERFENSKDSWTPNGKQRLVILERDDIIFIPPGLRILHAAHSPGKSVIEGGMFWDELGYLSTLAAIPWACESQRMSYERYAFRLPGIIDRLEELVTEQPDRFCRGLLYNKVKESLNLVFRSMSALS